MATDGLGAAVEGTMPRYLTELGELCRVPSVTSDESAIREMASAIEDRLKRAGLDVISDRAEGGHPTFIAHREGDSPRHLLFFNHYDVDPAGPSEAWATAPFEVVVEGDRAQGRGVADNKGTLLARLHAVELLAARGSLPCSVTFLVEAKRSMHAPHLGIVVDRHRDRLSADACLWENSAASEDGRPTLRLGDKGMLMVRVRARGTESNLSSQYASIFPSACWSLVRFLANVRGAEGKITVPGFERGVMQVSDEEERIFRAAPVDRDTLEKLAGVPLEPSDFGDLLVRYYASPTANIARISAGVGSEAMMSVNPSEAVSEIDFRLVPNQDADLIFAGLVELAEQGEGEIALERIGSMPPARTPVADPFVVSVIEQARSVYGMDAVLEPLSPTVGSRSVLSWSGMPVIGHGVAYAGSNIQSANEHVRLEDVKKAIRFTASIMESLR